VRCCYLSLYRLDNIRNFLISSRQYKNISIFVAIACPPRQIFSNKETQSWPLALDPTNIHIKFGEIFYFWSDVIHSGGRLDVHTSKRPKQLYERLHFYLPTKLQVADPLHVNLTHFDHRTKFDDIYKIPSNPWSAKAKATKKEPNDNE